jgi:ubiquitin C-terminal hydrolase
MFHSQHLTNILEKVQGKEFTGQFQHLWELYKSDQPGTLIPRGIIQALQIHLGNIFTSGQPVDVWEIWMFIWNLIADEMGKENERLKQIIEDPNTNDLVAKSEKAFAKGIWKNFSPWSLYLQGMFITQVQCPRCQECYHNFEHSIALALDIPQQDTDLQSCLKNMFEIEKVDGWKCDRCQKSFQAEKVCRLWRVPKVLVIALKRFVYNGHQWIKLETSVTIPETLTLDAHCIGVEKPTPYHLRGMCLHLGTCTGGHYLAHIKKGTDWFICDDTTIIPTSYSEQDSKMASTNTYLLFYEV